MSTITKKLVAGTSILALAAPFALNAALAQDAPPPTSQPTSQPAPTPSPTPTSTDPAPTPSPSPSGHHRGQ